MLASTKCYAQQYNCIQTCVGDRICISRCNESSSYAEVQTAPAYAFKQSYVQNVYNPSSDLLLSLINGIKTSRERRVQKQANANQQAYQEERQREYDYKAKNSLAFVEWVKSDPELKRLVLELMDSKGGYNREYIEQSLIAIDMLKAKSYEISIKNKDGIDFTPLK